MRTPCNVVNVVQTGFKLFELPEQDVCLTHHSPVPEQDVCQREDEKIDGQPPNNTAHDNVNIILISRLIQCADIMKVQLKRRKKIRSAKRTHAPK